MKTALSILILVGLSACAGGSGGGIVPNSIDRGSGRTRMSSGSDSGSVYIANYGNNTVTAYDLNGTQQTLTGSFSGLNRPISIAFDAHNSLLYVANLKGGNITAYDLQGNQKQLGNYAFNPQIMNGTFKPTAVTFDSHNNVLDVTWVTGNYSEVTVYSEDGTGLDLAASANGPIGAAEFDPQNNGLYLPWLKQPGLSVVDENFNAVTLPQNAFKTVNAPSDIVFDSSSGNVYVDNGNQHIDAYTASGSPVALSGNFPIHGNWYGNMAFIPPTDQFFILDTISSGSGESWTVAAYSEQGQPASVSGTFPNLNDPSAITYASPPGTPQPLATASPSCNDVGEMTCPSPIPLLLAP